MQDEKNGRKQDVAISRKQIDASVRYHVLKRYSQSFTTPDNSNKSDCNNARTSYLEFECENCIFLT